MAKAEHPQGEGQEAAPGQQADVKKREGKMFQPTANLSLLDYRPTYRTELCVHAIYMGSPCPKGADCFHAHSLPELKPHPYGPKFKTVPCNGNCPDPIRCQKLHTFSQRSHFTEVYDEIFEISPSLHVVLTVLPVPYNYMRFMLLQHQTESKRPAISDAHPLQRIEILRSNSFENLDKLSWWSEFPQHRAGYYFIGNPLRWRDAGVKCPNCKRSYIYDNIYHGLSCFQNCPPAQVIPIQPVPPPQQMAPSVQQTAVVQQTVTGQ
jgi:hypothetical protein